MTKFTEYDEVEALASWSPWSSFAEAARTAPHSPGVYLLRLPQSQEIVYVGMAGERKGQGLRGRMAIYRSGKGAASGFGEAAFDRALADEVFVSGQLNRLQAGEVLRAKQWAKDAIAHFSPEIRWTETADGAAALQLEKRVGILLHPHGLWNRLPLLVNASFDEA